MQILGKYNSTISNYLYTRLMSLFQTSISLGGNGGVSNISQADLSAIATQASTLSSVPTPSAGQRANDEQFNYPISLLQAKYGAIQDELNGFIAKTQLLLSKLGIETELLDKLIAQSELAFWESQLFKPYSSTSFSWDYNQGIGNLTSDLEYINPATSGVYPPNTNIQTVFNTTTGLRGGLASTYTPTVINPTNLNWNFTTEGQSQTLYSDNSAQLSILEPTPVITYSPNPSISVVLPNNGSVQNIFTIAGDTSKGPINTYIRTGFYPRTSSVQVAPYNAVNVSMTGWTLSLNGGSPSTISTPAPTGTTNLIGDLSSNFFQDVSGKNYLITSGETIYVEITLEAAVGTAAMTPFIDFYDISGVLVQSLQLNRPTPNGVEYTWFQKVVVPTNTAFRSAKLRLHTTSFGWTYFSTRVHTPVTVSTYDIVLDSLLCYSLDINGNPSTVYDSDTQYYIDENSLLTFFNIPDNIQITALFQEQFPYYQCSLNQINWSPIVLLDANNPYPEDQPIAQIVKTTNGQFPITNEEGIPTGLTISMTGKPLFPYLLIVGVRSNPNWGKQAVLEIDLESTKYISQLNIKPFSNFLPTLTQVQVEGFGSNSINTIFLGTQEIANELRIEFPRQLVGKVYLTFTQEGYTAKDHLVTDSDYVRRSVIEQIQNLLPPAAQRNVIADYNTQTGYQYDFGIENVYGVDPVTSTAVTISGAYRFVGQPKVVTFQAESGGSVTSYLCYKAMNLDGTVADFNQTGVQITSGQSKVIPYITGTNIAALAYVDFYIKHVLTSPDAYVTRFTLQVNDNV